MMRPSRFAILLVGFFSLDNVASFVPIIQQASRSDRLVLASTLEDQYLARVAEFRALTEETYGQQQTEISSILESIRIIEERVEAREASRVPPPQQSQWKSSGPLYDVDDTGGLVGQTDLGEPPYHEAKPIEPSLEYVWGSQGASWDDMLPYDEATPSESPPPSYVPPPRPVVPEYNSYVPPPPPPPPPPIAEEFSSYVPPPPPPPPDYPPPPPPPAMMESPAQTPNEYNNGAAAETFNGIKEGSTTGPPTLTMNGTPETTTFLEEDTTGELLSELPCATSLFAGSSFQLEEMEDRDGCSTEITLEHDQTVTVGMTDGPLFATATGTWWTDDDQLLLDMSICRQFEAGQKATNYTDLGEFSFAVERTYVGQVIRVGDRLAVSGTIHCSDELLGTKDIQVGYFNMIDNREGDDDEEEDSLDGIDRIPVGRSRVS